jgi:hypothetical protein
VSLNWIEWSPVLVTIHQISLCAPMLAALHLLVLVGAHLKLHSFVQICSWSMLSLGSKPPLAHYPFFIVCLATNFPKSSSTSEKLSVTAFKDLYVSRVPKNRIIISTVSSSGDGQVLSREIPTTSVTLQLCI